VAEDDAPRPLVPNFAVPGTRPKVMEAEGELRRPDLLAGVDLGAGAMRVGVIHVLRIEARIGQGGAHGLRRTGCRRGNHVERIGAHADTRELRQDDRAARSSAASTTMPPPSPMTMPVR